MNDEVKKRIIELHREYSPNHIVFLLDYQYSIDDVNNVLRQYVAELETRIAELEAELAWYKDESTCTCGWCLQEVETAKFLEHECPENPSIARREQLKAENSRLTNELAAAKEREAALAAALERIVTHSRDADCGDHCSNFCMYCQGRAALSDSSPILARVRRQAKLEALEGLPKEAVSHLLISDGLYAQGWNAYRALVVSAIAQLRQEDEANA